MKIFPIFVHDIFRNCPGYVSVKYLGNVLDNRLTPPSNARCPLAFHFSDPLLNSFVLRFRGTLGVLRGVLRFRGTLGVVRGVQQSTHGILVGLGGLIEIQR